MWKVLPETIKNHFSIRKRSYGDQNQKLYLPNANTDLFQRDIIYQGSKLGNTTPFDIRSKKQFTSLKAAHNNHLFYNQ